MSILDLNARDVNPTPSANPRDSWPAWTDQRWTLTPCRLDSPRPAETEEYRPTLDDVYHPTAEDDAEYEAWLAELDARNDVMAEWAAADHADRMEAAFGDPWDLVNPTEIAESGGTHPSQAYDLP